MKHTMYKLTLVGLGMAAGIAFAANPGYVNDASTSIVHTGRGECLHTGTWQESDAIVGCDKSAPAEISAMETVTSKELKPINLTADALFAFDSAMLTDQGKAKLDEVMQQMPTASELQDKRITITGFTDRIGSDSYNQTLSEKRAQSVHDYLVSRGLNDQNIDVKGMGSAQPLVGCEGEKGSALISCLAPNRRTTIDFSAMEVLKVEKQVPAGN